MYTFITTITLLIEDKDNNEGHMSGDKCFTWRHFSHWNALDSGGHITVEEDK